jgi:hypothetical protein
MFVMWRIADPGQAWPNVAEVPTWLIGATRGLRRLEGRSATNRRAENVN